MQGRLTILCALALVAGCTGTEQKQADTTAAAPPAPAAAPNVFTITASDFAFAAPDTIPAGVTTIRLVNAGPQIHHAQVIRLDQGKTLADLQAAMKAPGPLPGWAQLAGGPNVSGPGDTTVATQTLEPGSYALLCFVDTPDHVPHLAKGMTRALTVVPSTAPAAAEPTADMTVTLNDFTFTFAPSPAAGAHVIRVDNAATQPHEIVLIQLAPGKALKDLMAWAETYKGPPPGKPLGGVVGLSPGQHMFFNVTFTPGNYAVLCFLPDVKDGKPHLAHGMSQTFTVS